MSSKIEKISRKDALRRSSPILSMMIVDKLNEVVDKVNALEVALDGKANSRKSKDTVDGADS